MTFLGLPIHLHSAVKLLTYVLFSFLLNLGEAHGAC